MSYPAIPDFAIHHISISVPDVESAIAWYEEIFWLFHRIPHEH